MASTLTQAQIDAIKRDLGGDHCNDYETPELQAAYDEAEGDYCGTLALLWRGIWMSTPAARINMSNGGQALSGKASDLARQRLDYWEACAGTSGGTLGVGVLSLGIDATDEDEWD